MPTGLGSRKVLTPRSSKAPRRSLPPQARLVEAASFESVEDVPSSPDIMTQKLHEKVKEKKNINTTNYYNNQNNKANNSSSSFNQRISAAAAASNSLVSNAGRSKLSTEEFKLSDDNEDSLNLRDKYKRNDSSYKPTTTGSTGYTGTSGTTGTIGTTGNATNNGNYTNTTSNSYNSSSSSYGHNSGYNNTNKPSGYNASNNNRSFNSSYNSNISSSLNHNHNNNNNNNGYERWNLNGSESVELLKEQLSNQQRDYESLKHRFSELSRMRFSEPEEQLEEHKKLSDLRDQEAQKAIKSLQKEKEHLMQQLEGLKLTRAVDPVPVATTANNTENENENESLKITQSPTDPLNQWHCEFTSRSGRFEFKLTYESGLNRYQYVPLNSGSIKDLPPFLASDILITSDQMQLFFWRLLDSLSKRKDH